MLLLNRNRIKKWKVKKMGLWIESPNPLSCQDLNHAVGNFCWFDKSEEVYGITVHYQQHSTSNDVLISLDRKKHRVMVLGRTENVWVSGNPELAELVSVDGLQLKEIIDFLTPKIVCDQILLFQGGEQIEI